MPEPEPEQEYTNDPIGGDDEPGEAESLDPGEEEEDIEEEVLSKKEKP